MLSVLFSFLYFVKQTFQSCCRCDRCIHYGETCGCLCLEITLRTQTEDGPTRIDSSYVCSTTAAAAVPTQSAWQNVSGRTCSLISGTRTTDVRRHCGEGDVPRHHNRLPLPSNQTVQLTSCNSASDSTILSVTHLASGMNRPAFPSIHPL